MKKHLRLIAALLVLVAATSQAADFDADFEDSTLRLDYVLGGDSKSSAIYFEEASEWPGWAGRRCNLDAPLLHGNGRIALRDHDTGRLLYANTFSTLFQEWQCTPEAEHTARAFEATMIVPKPRQKVDITLTLSDNRRRTSAEHTFTLDPDDIYIKHLDAQTETTDLMRNGSPDECIDIAIMAEGYTPEQMDKFRLDARRACDALFSHEPFARNAHRFNVVAVASPSEVEGPAVPHNAKWGTTAAATSFDTFGAERYLTTRALHRIWDTLAGIPAEHVIVLANTPLYGGAGIYNQVTTSAADHPTYREVLVHEFGHAFGGLADEYFYGGDDDTTYPVDIEPWEPNITTQVDFESKWADMMDRDDVNLYEGGGYKEHGIYRPADTCRMRVNEVDHFCPVCTHAIEQMIDWHLSPAADTVKSVKSE